MNRVFLPSSRGRYAPVRGVPISGAGGSSARQNEPGAEAAERSCAPGADRLVCLHWTLVLLHGVLGAATLLIPADVFDLKLQLYQTEAWLHTNRPPPSPPPQLGAAEGTADGADTSLPKFGFRVVPRYVESVHIYPALCLAAVFFWTAAFHLWYVFRTLQFSQSSLLPTVNPWRWLEYGPSAALVALVVAVSVGMRSVVEIVAVGALTAVTMAFGLWSEIEIEAYKTAYKTASQRLRASEGSVEAKPNNVASEKGAAAPQQPRLQTAWIAFACGLFPQVTAWVFMFDAYAGLTRVASDEGRSIPDFVTAIIICECVLFMAFAAVHALRLLLLERFRPDQVDDAAAAELAYAVLSFVSKALLGVLLLVYAFTADSFEKAFSGS